MIKPPQSSDMADRIASQSWQLLKPHLDLQFSRLSSVSPQSIGTTVSVTNQSISHLLATILPEVLSSLNQAPMEAISSAKINQVLLGYRFTIIQKDHSLKSIYMADKIKKYLPLISKIQSLHLPLSQPSEERLVLQPNVVIASFPFPNAPISSEYFKYFELFQKKNLPSHKKPNKKKRRHLKRKRN